MNRRSALKHFAITGAAAFILPGCVVDSRKVSVALENLKITPDDEELLASLAETLIPATDKPGAKEVGAHLFALVMVDDCETPEKKELFLSGLRAFNKNTFLSGNTTFIEASSDERLKTLQELENSIDNVSEPIREFYKTSKNYIIQGYTNSSYFMTEVKPYKLVPGPKYKGCVPLSVPTES